MNAKQPFNTPNTESSIPERERKIQAQWAHEDVFQKSVDTRDKAKSFVFYDGPPFATGLPHYGHLVASTIKDVVPRYWSMKALSRRAAIRLGYSWTAYRNAHGAKAWTLRTHKHS